MAPGELIDGKYVVDRTLGHGGMGIVVAARHLHIGTPVAIKLLQPEARPELAKRLVREAHTCSRLRGPNVAQVIDAGSHEGRPYLVMELLEGRDLGSLLDDTTLAPHVACSFIMQACEGLGEAHALGLVHRDVKPPNLYLTTAGHIKVLDFGIATATEAGVGDERLTGVHEVMGSPGYMSPEQLRGKSKLDARSDIWSLGVTLYELVSGRHPFGGEHLASLLHAIVYEPHAPLHEVSRELAAIVDRCLAKDPAKRFASTRELAWALAPFAADPLRGQARYLAPIGDLAQLHRVRMLGVDARVVEVPQLPNGELARGSRISWRPSRFLFRPRTLGAVAAVALLVLVGFVGAGADVAPVAKVQMQPTAPVAPTAPSAPVVTPIEIPTPSPPQPAPKPAVAPRRGGPDFVFAPTPSPRPLPKHHRRPRR